MDSTWEDFFAKNPPPQDFSKNEALLQEFIQKQLQENNKVVLITSGGTMIPLEHNMVRFVDNFSAGFRGSVSAEYFLENGYAVIFLYRFKSLEPFSRHFVSKKLLDMFTIEEENNKNIVRVSPEHTEKVALILKKYHKALQYNKLLQIGFTTLAEYFWLLRSTCQVLACLNDKALLYLAAAVSDFYIPSDKMSVHKISSDSATTISLQLVPKLLEPLVNSWVPHAFVISFKLETDKNLLISKARSALNKYKHNLVIANMLQTRKQEVIIVSKESDHVISLTDEQLNKGEEIEKLIVAEVVSRHKNFMLANSKV